MGTFWLPPELKSYWLTPAAAGVLLILIGVTIYANPNLLAYVVAALFILLGLALLSIAWQMRGRVTYRRIDEAPRPDERDEQ